MTATLTDKTVDSEVMTRHDGQVLTFPRGLLGFESHRQFRLVRQPEWEPFAKLQSVEDPRLSFVVAPPRVFAPDFMMRVDPLEVGELGLRDAAQADLWAIVTIPDDPRRMSANLQGPIVVNRTNSKAKQVVLTRSPYTTQQMIFEPETVPA